MNDFTLYEDKDIKITTKVVIIKWYTFPTAKDKIISIKQIKKIEIKQLGWTKVRLWGMSMIHWGYWLAGDRKRLSRKQFIALHINNHWIKPSFTTQQTQMVTNIIRQLMNNYSTTESQQNYQVISKNK